MKNIFTSVTSIFLSLIISSITLPQNELSPEQIYEKVNDGVVIVLSYDSNGELISQGSGVVLSKEGYVLTNYHIMSNANNVGIFHDGKLIENVEIMGGDVEYDFLVLRIPLSEFSAITIAELNDLKVGQRIYAIGSPVGYENTLSEGIISGFRQLEDGRKLIQITASISPGSSGGAVVDSKGELIGISTYTVTEGQNINFAIPINDIKKVEIKPYVVTDKIFKETKPKEEEKIVPYIEPNIPSYDPKALEYFNTGKGLISKAYSQENKEGKISFLRQAVNNLDMAIKFDSSIAEAYYLIGKIYSNWFYLDDEKSAQKYYDEVLSIIKDMDGEIFDSISVRELLVEIGDFYNRFDSDPITNKLKAVNIYKNALSKSLIDIIPKFPWEEITDNDINYKIASSYLELANETSINDYWDASTYYDNALEYANKLHNAYEWFREDIIIDDKVALELHINFDWLPFRILCRNLRKPTDFFKDCKPLESNNILYLYHSKTITKDENNIVRVWIKKVNLREPEEGEYDYYDYSKSLYEFDLKNNTYRVLQYASYYDNKVLNSENYPNAEWQYVIPETIAEIMIENMKIITK